MPKRGLVNVPGLQPSLMNTTSLNLIRRLKHFQNYRLTRFFSSQNKSAFHFPKQSRSVWYQFEKQIYRGKDSESFDGKNAKQLVNYVVKLKVFCHNEMILRSSLHLQRSISSIVSLNCSYCNLVCLCNEIFHFPRVYLLAVSSLTLIASSVYEKYFHFLWKQFFLLSFTSNK